ncbi:uncharacterized protein VDAG_07346 [Verticillium dahliae VdLs.17]|uniref:Uncharacterized protein n=1 Tax=Verticillium dahliae (strain VdLs.17 / ATCC MYA-4575 / FGSC 10137) TaxID=498257 RepID=G2XAW7_VERDV|nr:uncharacterized protein VDAG_07346 [Verticillium dahliae VdLs.17]EGY16182.1 hypothetical protein VDAG_07346 [Verticillium dahliae VdLs.17]KAH6702739.1 hypothetical protein EV126DRAFT_383259 [Verticillium dahliae]
MPEGRQSPEPERQSGKQQQSPPGSGQGTDNADNKEQVNADQLQAPEARASGFSWRCCTATVLARCRIVGFGYMREFEMTDRSRRTAKEVLRKCPSLTLGIIWTVSQVWSPGK